MRISLNIDWLEQIILKSGIGTKIQRAAIVQRIKDALQERKEEDLT